MKILDDIDIYADGANLDQILNLYSNPLVKGFTTNPTLMRKDGVNDYISFSKSLLSNIKDLPVSFEVFADDAENIYRQAMEISSWAENVNVKIPVMNTKGESMSSVINNLSKNGVKINVTAIFTLEQVNEIIDCINPDVQSIFSVFAGRIADTGRDPIPIMHKVKERLNLSLPNSKLLWASPRQVYNIIDAANAKADIITMAPELIRKIDSFGKDLDQFSLETVQMFYNDAITANYKI